MPRQPSLKQLVLNHLHAHKDGARSADYLREIYTGPADQLPLGTPEEKREACLNTWSAAFSKVREMEAQAYQRRVAEATKDSVDPESTQGKWLAKYTKVGMSDLNQMHASLLEGVVCDDEDFTERIRKMGPVLPDYFTDFRMTREDHDARTAITNAARKRKADGEGVLCITHDTANRLVEAGVAHIKALPGVVEHLVAANDRGGIKRVLYEAAAYLKLLTGRRKDEIMGMAGRKKGEIFFATFDLDPENDNCLIVGALHKGTRVNDDTEYNSVPCLCDPGDAITAIDLVREHVRYLDNNEVNFADKGMLGPWAQHNTIRGLYARICYHRRHQLGFMPNAIESRFMQLALAHKAGETNAIYISAVRLEDAEGAKRFKRVY